MEISNIDHLVRKNCHSGLISHVLNPLKILENSGFVKEKLIKICLLKHFDPNQANAYIPLFTIYEFFEQLDRLFGIRNFPSTLYTHSNLIELGIPGNYIGSHKLVLPQLLKLVKYDHFFSTNQNIKLHITGDFCVLSNSFSDPPGPGQHIMCNLWLHAVLNLLDLKNKNRSQLCEIHLSGHNTGSVPAFPVDIETVLRFGQEQFGVVFRSALLTKKTQTQKKHPIQETQIPRPPINFRHSIYNLLSCIKENQLPSLQLMASFYNVSVASLKRYLQAENSGYNLIVEQWRFTKSVHLLTHTNLAISEISEKLFYANAANFIRAFKRWIGQSPGSFRKTGSAK